MYKPGKKKIILFLFLFISFPGYSQPKSFRFRHLTYEEGLTNSNVYAFCQDEQGFMWLGTEGGLFRFDGFRFKVYKSSIADSNSINSNFVFSLLNDSRGNLWIGTYKGLMLYDRKFDNFIDFNLSEKYLPDDAAAVQMIYEIPKVGILVASNAGCIVVDPVLCEIDNSKTKALRKIVTDEIIMAYHFDPDEHLWIGTLSGIYLWNLKDKKAKLIDLSEFSGKPESNFVIGFHQDLNGDLWVSTRGGGVLRKQSESSHFQAYLHEKENPASIGSNECYDFWESRDGELWISTNGGGINFYNRHQDNFTRLTVRPQDKFGILNNNTRAIYEDNQGNIWISSFQAGVNILINTPYQFNHQSFEIGTEKGYQSTSVISFFLENEEVLWVGTDGGGLKRLNRSTGEIKTLQPVEEEGLVFPDKVVMNIYSDYRGKLWMGTYLEGLVEFDPKTFQHEQHRNNPNDPNSISSNYVSVILEDTKGNLWIGTNGGGLNLYDNRSNKFISFRNDPDNSEQSLVNDFINVIEEDFNGDLWIGTYWGLSKFSTRDFTFKNFLANKDLTSSLSSNVIYSLLLDSKNRLWIGTRMGLVRYDFNADKFIHYLNIEGISNNQINGILEDNKGELWLSTDNGLIRYSPESQTVHRYSVEDGLQGNEFYHNACYKGFNGELFFGGYKGFNSFFADSIKERFYEPEVILTNLRILDREIPIGKLKDGRIILKKNITLSDEIELKHFDKSFSLGFSAVDFIEGGKNIYAYRLDNFDDGWNYTNAGFPFATYTNLSPGEYTFRIKAGKSEIIDRIANEKSIKIIIEPPLWRRWWAYFIYTLITLFIVFYFWRISLQRLKEKNEIKLEKIKREQTEAISQARMRFFTNISHEIRTPLTLILGPLEQLLAKGKEIQPYRRQFDIMLKNARRLLRLINQLLDLRKIELKKMKLNAEYADLTKFVKDIFFSFEEYASDKRIDFHFHSQQESIKIWFDPDKMDKIVFNLLSNSFKYTPERGKIKVGLRSNVSFDSRPYNYVELLVSDTGKGIKQDEIKNIFNRFYQGKTGTSDSPQGWGLGLSMTYSFVELHKGFIEVESAENVGTQLKIYFPDGDEHLDEEEKIHDISEPGLNKYIHISSEPYIDRKPEIRYEHHFKKEKQYQLLVVEDNKDLRDYLMSELEIYYNCFEAADGKSGMEMAVDIMPDIILSDIMMPGMSGIELCIDIKANLITSHIPVVLLTAKSNVEDQIKGFESGADAYIPKPFNIEKLIANLNSILENRKKLREKFRTFPGEKIQKRPDSADDKFLSLVDGKLLENISDTQFGVEELAREIGMSRGHLHRKMRAIANIGPNEYIRKNKMQKAAHLLLHGDLSVAEISIELGFNSTSYFSSTFKSFFHVSPSTFIEKNSLL